MKQAKLLKHVYKACLNHDTEAIDKLRVAEYQKIFKHKAKNKPFDAKWTSVKI